MGAAWRDFASLWPTLVALFAIAAVTVMGVKIAANLGSALAGRPLIAIVVLESIVPLFAYGIFFSFAMAAATVAIHEHHDGRRVTVAEAIRAVRPPAKDLVTAGILSGMIAVAFLTLLPPAILFFPLFFGPPAIAQVIALDKVRLSVAGTRARALVTGETMRAVGALMPGAIFTGSLIFFGPYAAADATRPLGTAVQQTAAISARISLEGVLVGAYAALVYAMFDDLRRRRDGARPEPESGDAKPESRPDPNRKKKKKKR